MSFLRVMNQLDVDVEQMIDDYNVCKELSGWSPQESYKQIGLRHRHTVTENKWWDSEGGLTHRGLFDTAFNTWNDQTPRYTKFVCERICEMTGFPLGRVRYMTQATQTGLKMHSDANKRLHFVIKTNPDSYIFHKEDNLTPYHMKVIPHFYLVNTQEQHFVYNAGVTDRVHLLIS